MSSSSKFPSGLNNWEGSDKPTRIDFVTDNEILDENVLWKTDYDPDGEVEEAGGITAYAMAKETYDLDGEVLEAGGIASYALAKETYDANGAIAEAGGIAAAIAANEGVTLYSHEKSGTVHSLTATKKGSNIKFYTTASFVEGDTFAVNGVACTAKTSQGKALPTGFFAKSVVVSCFLRGSVLNFNGGGESIDIKVVTASSLAALQVMTVSKNTIGVITSTALPTPPAAQFGIGAPNSRTTAVGAGGIWIDITTEHKVNMFDAFPGSNFMRLTPANVLQNVAGVWTQKTAYFYNGSTWTLIVPQTYLYKKGDQMNGTTGGWGALKQGNGAVTFHPTQVNLFTLSGNEYAIMRTNWYINFSKLSKMKVQIYSVDGIGQNGKTKIRVYISASNNVNPWDTAKMVSYFDTTSAGEKTLSMTGITGNYFVYIATMSESGALGAVSVITNVWGE